MNIIFHPFVTCHVQNLSHQPLNFCVKAKAKNFLELDVKKLKKITYTQCFQGFCNKKPENFLLYCTKAISGTIGVRSAGRTITINRSSLQ